MVTAGSFTSSLLFVLLCLLTVSWRISAAEETCDVACQEKNPDYLIVGAGGAGIQAALLLQKYKMSYCILESTDTVGSFWTKFPVFETLISVNKWVRNETQRFRYDWHSFLETQHKMLDVTEDYFPTGKDWHLYMNMVARKENLQIDFGTQVQSISQDKPCVVLVDGSERCANRRVFVGTGLRPKSEPYLEAMGGIPYSAVTLQEARHRRVCILGNGNAGWEVAQNVYGVADRVVLYGKESHRLSAVTKYTGDVRVKFLQVLENLHGKLLDTVEKFDYSFTVRGLEDFLNETQTEVVADTIKAATVVKQFNCEMLVIATGFRSHVPGLHLGADERFPPTGNWYVSTHNPAVHYIGWLMHGDDFRRGAGGFLSGYRYLIRNLVHQVREEDENTRYPFLVLRSKEEVAAHVVKRSQTASDLIILQDGVVVRDAIAHATNSAGEKAYLYYEGISYKFHPEIYATPGIIFFYFAWGDGRRLENVFDNVLRFSDTNKLINLFIHPVIEVDGYRRDMMEDLEMAWSSSGYVESIDKTIKAALGGDFSLFGNTKPTKPYKRATINETQTEYEEATEKGLVDDAFVTALWKAVQANGAPDYMEKFREATMQWHPSLFEAVS